jgi:hypothetical protein
MTPVFHAVSIHAVIDCRSENTIVAELLATPNLLRAQVGNGIPFRGDLIPYLVSDTTHDILDQLRRVSLDRVTTSTTSLATANAG